MLDHWLHIEPSHSIFLISESLPSYFLKILLALDNLYIIDDIKNLLGGLLSPEITEKITGNVEIREVFNISKVGNIAGCIVKDGFILRKSQIRILRDNVVIHTGGINSLKRFKDEVKEVKNGYECGVMIENYSDIKVGDIIETFEEIKTNRKL